MWLSAGGQPAETDRQGMLRILDFSFHQEKTSRRPPMLTRFHIQNHIIIGGSANKFAAVIRQERIVLTFHSRDLL